MATVFTHALFATSMVPLAPKDVPRWRLTITMVLLSAIPDLDVIGYWFGIPYGDPLGHRGWTHALSFAALMALPLMFVVFRDLPRFSKTWWATLALLFGATASHGFLDAMTDAGHGIGFFIPFDNDRYFFPFRPLATSPLSIKAFFRSRGVRIMLNEFVWVWIPCLSFAGLVSLARLARARRKNPTDI